MHTRAHRNVTSDPVSPPHGRSDDGAGGSRRQLHVATLADVAFAIGSRLARMADEAHGGITVDIRGTRCARRQKSLRADVKVRGYQTDRTQRRQARADHTVSSNQLPQIHARSHAFHARADWHAHVRRKDGRARMLQRLSATKRSKCCSPVPARADSRTRSLLLHPPRASFEEKDSVSARQQISVTRVFAALENSFRPGEHHPRAASGAQISCAHPCHRAPDGADGSVLRGEGGYGKEIVLRSYMCT
jgi:hypothetical protein